MIYFNNIIRLSTSSAAAARPLTLNIKGLTENVARHRRQREKFEFVFSLQGLMKNPYEPLGSPLVIDLRGADQSVASCV